LADPINSNFTNTGVSSLGSWNWNFFGFNLFGNKKKIDSNPILSPNTSSTLSKSFALPPNEDGAVLVQSGAYYGTYVDLDGVARNEVEQITKYREMSMQAEADLAIRDIVNEAIVRDNSGKVVDIVLDNVPVADSTKKKIQEEFNNILRILNFGNLSMDIFRRWYVDGRLFYHIIIDDSKPAEGIQELRYIDPRRIRKIKEILKSRDPKTGTEIVQNVREYYVYNERGMLNAPVNLGLKIAPDSVAYVPSGLLDSKNNNVVSYLHAAIKPLNQLRMVEDALVIYRIARAPERRVFYIDVGNMPSNKAQQYIQDIMVKYKNKLIYDVNTGEIRDDRKFLSMLEDFWLPRREGGRGTEISTLPGGENLGQIQDIEYFLTRLYKALNVPVSRLEPQQGFSLGRTTEITRDELKFMKFVDGLRLKFSQLFDELLRVQLILKNILTEDEWKKYKQHICYDFLKDNNFTELKETELIRERMTTLALVDPYQGKYFSVDWIRKNVLRQTDEDIKIIDQQIEEEAMNPRFQNPALQGLGGEGMGQPGMPPNVPGQQQEPQPGKPFFSDNSSDEENPEKTEDQNAPEMDSGANQDDGQDRSSRFYSQDNGFIPVDRKKYRKWKKT
jgi:hypothetical protein